MPRPRKKKKKTNEFFKDGVLLHHVFAKHLVEKYNIIQVDDVLHMYDDGCYVANEKQIKQVMVKQIPELTRTQRNETYDYLTLTAPRKERDTNYISFENWLYNIKNHELVEHDHEIITTNKIPLNIDLDTYSEVVDKALDKLTCNDTEVRQLLEEMIGYLFLPTNKYQKAFILIGKGKNGKSTFIKMVQALIGKNNYSALALQELNERFSRAELLNKMANLGDDIPKRYVKDSSTLKKLVTGDELKAEEKGKKPFTLKPYAKFIFACNEMVTFDDQSDGLYRRLVHVPFNAIFSKSEESYDPNIEEKLVKEESLQYLFNIAIEGLKRLEQNKGFTEPKIVKQVEEEFLRNNNHVVEFLEEYSPVEKTLDEMYVDYSFWVAQYGYEKVQLTRHELSKNIKTIMNMELRSMRKKGVEKVSKVFKFVTGNGHIYNFGNTQNP